MKTLSVRQPWAWLICSGIKDIENRTWRTSYRGELLIHAPSKFDLQYRGMNLLKQWDSFSPLQMETAWSARLELSAIIGKVELVDCIRYSFSIWAEEDCWNWVLINPVLFKNPILNVPGKLSLWEYEYMKKRSNHDPKTAN